MSDPKKIYKVQIFEDGFGVCECNDYLFRGQNGSCKHIKFILKNHYEME